MASETIDYQALDHLLDELDVKSKQQPVDEEEDSYWVCQRKHPRHPFRATCKVHFLPSGSMTVSTLAGRTRNLSRNGIAILVRRMFSNGDPIEVEVVVPGRSRIFMAGLVCFCRYAGRGYHELGVELKVAGKDPVFSRDPMLASRTLDWLQRAEVRNR